MILGKLFLIKSYVFVTESNFQIFNFFFEFNFLKGHCHKRIGVDEYKLAFIVIGRDTIITQTSVISQSHKE